VATKAELTVALAQNRQGRVLVAGDRYSEAWMLLVEHMMICSKVWDLASETWTFSGYAPGFEALELGRSPPSYAAVITARDDAPVTLTFRHLN
jgi:hypothetical protein